ncbi:hypothetical protein Tco_0732136, partial [Tanacetum coccineum]
GGGGRGKAIERSECLPWRRRERRELQWFAVVPVVSGGACGLVDGSSCGGGDEWTWGRSVGYVEKGGGVWRLVVDGGWARMWGGLEWGGGGVGEAGERSRRVGTEVVEGPGCCGEGSRRGWMKGKSRRGFDLWQRAPARSRRERRDPVIVSRAPTGRGHPALPEGNWREEGKRSQAGRVFRADWWMSVIVVGRELDFLEALRVYVWLYWRLFLRENLVRRSAEKELCRAEVSVVIIRARRRDPRREDRKDRYTDARAQGDGATERARECYGAPTRTGEGAARIKGRQGVSRARPAAERAPRRMVCEGRALVASGSCLETLD